MRVAIVLTTIHDPQNLDILLNMIEKDDLIIIVTDRKTPKINKRDNVHIVDIKKQISICKNPIGVPFDCIQRRNFGYIYAIKYLNPEYILTIDDDNFPISDKWLSDHISNIGFVKEDVYNSRINIINKTLNIRCDLHNSCLNIVHRGVCFEQMLEEENSNNMDKKYVYVGVNAGMWNGDPDVNAYDRILHPNIKSSSKNINVVIDPKKWFHPFNSQNTIFEKTLFPALFLIPMFSKFYGYKFGRFDDIWQSYICQKIMSRYDMCVRFGSPIVKQDRNNHSILNDLQEEYPGMLFTNKIIKKLNDIKLLCDNPMENMYEIADNFLLSEEEILKYIGNKILWWLTEIK